MCKQTKTPNQSTIISRTTLLVLSCLSLYINPIITVTSESLIKSIGISQIVEHPALDAVRQEMLNTLKKEGFEPNKNLNIIYENAQGNMITAAQIASKLLHANLDLVVGISTPSTQTLFYEAKKSGQRIPIVFSAISDPKAAKLDSDNEYPITGITDTPHLDGLLELINAIMPKLKTLGLMYNPSEVNSVSTINRLKQLLKGRNILFVETTVNKTQDISQATKSLIGKVEALYFPQDNTLVSAIPTIINITSQPSSLLPIFTSDPILVKKGVLAAVGYDYEDIGKETGQVVAKILKGKPAQQITIHNPVELKAVINGSLAKKLGVSIPKKLKHSKIQVIE